MEKNKRNSNIEALRVFSMIGIVILHYIYHGLKSQDSLVLYQNNLSSFIDYSLIEILYILTSVSVNCYVLISGYFLINKTNYRFRQLLKLWVQVLFYSVIISCILNYNNFDLKNIMPNLTPIMTNQYWFITSYMAMILLSPYISILVSQITKSQYITLLIILAILTLKPLYGKVYGNFDSILYFILLYAVGGYFRLYNIPKLIVNNIKKIVCITILSFYLLVTLLNVYNYQYKGIDFQLKSTAYNDGVFFLSVLIFIFFIKIKTENSFFSFISKFAPYTLGVYLIHDNSIIRNIIWKNIIPENYSFYIITHCLICALSIFLICVFIDFIRDYVFKTLKINSITDLIYNHLENKIIKAIAYVKTKRT